MNYENEYKEFKADFTDVIYKEVIAFANSEGGVIYIGFDDNGNAIGLKNVDDTYTRITNGIRDNIAPDVTLFIRYTLQDNKTIKVEVSEGSYKPYYLKSKGLKSNGVYVRQGASSVQASPELIRKLIKEADGDIYESMRTLEQNLTFNETQEAFEKNNVPFTEDKYIKLGLRNINDDLYTNLALLLSDQCKHSIKVAVFADMDNTTFKDSKEFTGSIFKQMEDTLEYLNLCNKKTFLIEGIQRTEKSDYPIEAIREGLLNAIVHRDYSFSGSIIVNVNDERIEFISIGGLLPGLCEDDIRNGISQPRNKNLADIFYRLRLIEAYGTGIKRIFNLYKDCPIKPSFNITHNSFKLILPNMNTAKETITETKEVSKSSIRITEQMKVILSYLEEHEYVTEEEVQDLLDIKKTRAYILTKEMSENELLDIIGRGNDKKFILHK